MSLDAILPDPDFVVRDPDAVTREMIARYEQDTGKTLYPAQVERILLDVIAYRESLLREAIQDAAKLNLVRFSRAPILDYLGENAGVTRLVDEDDDHYRQRICLAPEQYSTAGSIGAYKFHALSAHPDIVDVAVLGPKLELQNNQVVSTNFVPAGMVFIAPLMRTGLPSAAVLQAVQTACSADKVRPLTDYVVVAAPPTTLFSIVAEIVLLKNADAPAVLAAAQAAAASYCARMQAQLGLDIVRSQIIAELKVAGVYDVNLIQPAANVVLEEYYWPQCSSVQISIAGVPSL